MAQEEDPISGREGGQGADGGAPAAASGEARTQSGPIISVFFRRFLPFLFFFFFFLVLFVCFWLRRGACWILVPRAGNPCPRNGSAESSSLDRQGSPHLGGTLLREVVSARAPPPWGHAAVFLGPRHRATGGRPSYQWVWGHPESGARPAGSEQ